MCTLWVRFKSGLHSGYAGPKPLTHRITRYNLPGGKLGLAAFKGFGPFRWNWAIWGIVHITMIAMFAPHWKTLHSKRRVQSALGVHLFGKRRDGVDASGVRPCTLHIGAMPKRIAPYAC
jgi:hypothetical protein